jgi:hypothetical protein
MLAPDACLEKVLTDDVNQTKKENHFHLISEIFCPPRPIIQPMRSLAIVISRCVCKVARLGGRPFAINGAIIKKKTIYIIS